MRSKSYKSSKSKKSKDSYSKESNGKEYQKAKLNATGRDNDPNFYFTNAELAQQAGQLSFQNMLGLGGIDDYKVPSINKIYLNPCPGITVSGEEFYGDPIYNKAGTYVDVTTEKRGINLMSSKLYTMLSTFTGRTSQYAPQDVALMILAISSIAELSETIRRCFGIALTYNPRNRNLPLGLLRTMGLDVADFLANIPAYRMRFNVAMTRINQIPLLDNIAYIRKSRDIYQRIYMDSPSPMAQIFYYMPYSVWKLDEVTDPQGSMLKTVGLYVADGTSKKLSVWLEYLEEMITALLESSTLNLIYADLLNMANKIKVPVWQFDYLAENYVVMPEFNRNALLQYHHVRVMGEPILYNQTGEIGVFRKKKHWKISSTTSETLTTNDIEFTSGNVVVCDPNTNNVVYNPLFLDFTYTKAVVDMDNPNPTLEDKIEALRFSVTSSGSKIARYDWTTQHTSYDYLQWLPSLPDHYAVWDFVYDNVDYTAPTLTSSPVWAGVQVNTVQVDTVISREKFSMHPMLYIIGGSAANLQRLTGNLDFYTIVDYEYLRRVNEMMYTGLFDFRV